mgnify:CR=1 FL=1
MNDIAIRKASVADLDDINNIIHKCVFSWDLPDRVKRLTVQSYCYDEFDLDNLDIFVATDSLKFLVGVASLEQATKADLPETSSGLLLHGLYVNPEYQHQGVGQKLIHQSFQHVRHHQLQGLLVKAQCNANSYFDQQGFEKLAVNDANRDYPHRWWKSAIN